MAESNDGTKAKQGKRNIKVEDLPGKEKELSKDEMKSVGGGGLLDDVSEFFSELADDIKSLYEQNLK